jgi:predicted secreted Zn-dependent protease
MNNRFKAGLSIGQSLVGVALVLSIPGGCAWADALRPIVDLRVAYYSVTGQTISEIQKSIAEHAEQGGHVLLRGRDYLGSELEL